MRKSLWPSGLIAALCFIVALYLGLKEPKDRRVGEPWVQVELAAVESIVYADLQKSVEILPTSGSSAWVKVKTQDEKEQMFLAGARVRDLFFSFSPIWASKKLGSPSAKKKKEYGLDGTKTLRVNRRDGSPLNLLIGGRGFQSGAYFIMDKANQKAFLWNREPIDLIQDPSRLAMRTLEFFNPEAINAIAIRGNGINREIIKTSKIWKEKGKPLSADDPIFDWLENLSGLKIEGYQQRPQENPSPMLDIALRTESLMEIKVLRSGSPPVYRLDFGPSFPQLQVESKAIEPLLLQGSTETLKP